DAKNFQTDGLRASRCRVPGAQTWRDRRRARGRRVLPPPAADDYQSSQDAAPGRRDRLASRSRRRLFVRRRRGRDHAQAASRRPGRSVGPRRVRELRSGRPRGLLDPRGVPVAHVHVRDQPRDQGGLRPGHPRRSGPRRHAAPADPGAVPRDDDMTETIEQLANQEYKYGFVTDIEADTAPPGLSEEIIRLISTKKDEPEWMLDFRLKSFRHWLTMTEPTWANVKYGPIDYQGIRYYSAPKKKKQLNSLDEVDPELRSTFEKLGISLDEQKRLSGVAVDAVFDSVSVATTFQAELAKLGIIFCSFSEAVKNHPDLVRKYLGSVVPYTDNFFATLNSAVFSDGSFCYIPKGVRCPMELSTYFRINTANTGQFERTLIVADEGSYVSYL